MNIDDVIVAQCDSGQKKDSIMKDLSARYQRILWVFAGLGAAWSLLVGSRGAVSSSRDFQWGGSHLLLNGVDPWNAALTSNTPILHFSPPNYLHELYILMAPLGEMSFYHAAAIWCGISIGASILCVAMLQKIFSLTFCTSAVLLLTLWMSAPFRTSLQLGQMSVFELFLFCIVFYATNIEVRGLALGLGLSKYSFGPVFVSTLFFRRKLHVLMIAIVPPLVGMLVAWMLLGRGALMHLASEPLAVSRIHVWPGMADVMTAVESVMAAWMPRVTSGRLVAYILGLSLSVVYGFLLSRRRLTHGAEFTLVAVASLITVKHLMYDYVFLVVPLGYALSRAGKGVRTLVMAIVGIFWFLSRCFPALQPEEVPGAYPLAMMLTAVCLLATLLFALTRNIFAGAEAMSIPEPDGLQTTFGQHLVHELEA